MTIGMKAPRWPEFYIPRWLNKKPDDASIEPTLFAFISKTVTHFKKQKHIRYWQVENEPLDPSGPHRWVISFDRLAKEVDLVRHVDASRNIVINLWGNELTKRNLYPQAVRLADVIGIDLYPRVPGPMGYRGPLDSDDQLRHVIEYIKAVGKQWWISELQTEPWGLHKSCLPQHIIENTQWALQFAPDALWYWGYEYWYERHKKGDDAYWKIMQKAV